MTLGIKYKLFLVITLVCAIVALGMFFLMQWSFDRGFLNYVNKAEMSMFETVRARVNEEYTEQESWQFIKDEPRLAHEIIVDALPDYYRFNEGRPPPHKRQRKKGRKFRDGNRAQHPDGNRRRRLDENRSHQPDGETGPLFGDEIGPPPGLDQLLHRFNLFDAEKLLLIGPPRSFNEKTAKEIEYQGVIVGYLGLEPRRVLSLSNELQFSEQQTDTLILIALGTFILAGLLALPLANHFVRPITRLKQSTQVLASGQYKIRIKKLSNDELGELSNDFNILAKTLEKNELARQRWIADISHELRTPIAILRGEIEAIIDGVREADDKSIDSLHQEILQLNRLVDDLYELSLSDLGALNYRKSEIDICDVLDTVVESFNDSFQQKNIQIKSNSSSQKQILFFGDRDRLHQLFSNLLNNSLNYTNPDGLLEIEIHSSTNKLTIHFRDTAPGVTTEDLPKLFDRLYRADSSRNRTTGGAGLGMALVKNIVEAHQGSVTAFASPLGGLSVKIELPLNNI